MQSVQSKFLGEGAVFESDSDTVVLSRAISCMVRNM